MKKILSLAVGAVLAASSFAAIPVSAAPMMGMGMGMGMGHPHMDHGRMASAIAAWCKNPRHWNDSDCRDWRHGTPHWSDAQYQNWYYRHHNEHGFDPGLALFFGFAAAAGAAAANAHSH